LQAVVSFHGSLPTATAAEAQRIKAHILVCHGADDTFIPAETVKAFRDVLDKNKVRYEFVSYPGVLHSFTVPKANQSGLDGLKYDKAADEDSWKRMRELFEKTLSK
jgi:dienelactone hydrolase